MKRVPFLAMLALCASPVAAFAAEPEVAASFSPIDTMWVLLAAVLVFLMQAGFGMVEAGLIRSKNSVNVLTKNVLDMCTATLAYFLCGYAIMFGAGTAFFGTTGWALIGAESAADGVPLEAFWLFQAVFAGAAATIVSGAVAGRMRFVAYLIYSFLITALVYPIVGHWVWGGGWLAELNFHDFAGSTVVHGVGGTAALVGAWMLGPRIGRFTKDGSKVIAGHSMPLVTLGVIMLWFGWYGFNAGSTLSFSDPQTVARIAMNTTMAPAAGAITAMITAWLWFGKPDLSITLNGVLAGLVAVTAPCAVIDPASAMLIGAVAGVLVVVGIRAMEMLRIDDPVGAVPVHCFNGIWGTLAVGLLGREALGAPADGLFFGGGVGQLGVQALGVAACFGFTALSMLVVFKAIDLVIGLRVDELTEVAGLDLHEHGMEAYSGFQIFNND
ncbi:MAG: Amt family ammonium transporter [Kiritimatiellia bacterium]|jgi:Amt family ammonium transporter